MLFTNSRAIRFRSTLAFPRIERERYVANLERVEHESQEGFYAHYTKRYFDILLGVLLLALVSPLLLLIAAAIKCTDSGPVFFLQLRYGKDQQLFNIIKFRTMFFDQHACSECKLAREQARKGILLKVEEDSRVTRLGKFLRTYSLDELPQLFNVVLGQMSLVGPRPALTFMAENHAREMRLRSRVRPGLTGLWQISARGHTSLDEQIVYDAEYIERLSPWTDLKILLLTIPAVVSGRGAK